MKQNKDRNGKTIKLNDMVLLPNGKLATVEFIGSSDITVMSIGSKQSFAYASWELSLVAKHIKTMEI